MKNKRFFEVGEYYHIFNRGVDKRLIFDDYFDMLRFYQSMQEFNTIEPIGSIYENRHKRKKYSCGYPTTTKQDGDEKLVEIIAYCLNPNHFHLILKPLVIGGLSEYIKRLSGGYSRFYNLKKERGGFLFQGRFKAVHIDSESYLRFLSVYVNLNFEVHQKFKNTKDENGKSKKLFFKSSWNEYKKAKIIKKIGGAIIVINSENDICDKSMILSHFDSISSYKKFAKETLESIKIKRYRDREVIKNNFSINNDF